MLKESSLSPQAPCVETPQTPRVETSMPMATGISPGKILQLRMKNLVQLRYLQGLFDNGILTEKEHAEQKVDILSLLLKL